jgi:hypothetical protein
MTHWWSSSLRHFVFSSPLFNNQPIMSPRDSMCQKKMAKKALTVHK